MRRRGWRNEGTKRVTRAGSRRLRAAVLAVAFGGGFGGGALSGETLLARAFPERAAQVRLALSGHQHAEALELAAAAGVGPGVRLASLDLAQVRAGVASHPWVRSARVAALPPDRLLVAVEEREPVALAPIGDVTWLVDRSGLAFLPASGEPLPVLAGAAAPDDPRLADGVAWLDALAAHGIPAPAQLALTDADPARAPALALAAGTAAPGARVLLGAGERDAKLARLARLLAAGLPELATTAEIDLRFGADVILRPRPAAEAGAVSNAASPVPPGAPRATRGSASRERAKSQVGG